MGTSTKPDARPDTGAAQRGGAWIVVALMLALAGIGVGAFTLVPLVFDQRPPVRDTLGGAFRLQSSAGGVLDSESLAGKPFLVFFGFTQCPNVCPTTLADMSSLIDRLHAEGGDIRALYITVDPQRDTAEVLAQYLTAFSDRIVGLTGTPREIAAVANAYRAEVRKVPLSGGDYTIEHTLMVYLMDGQGRFASPLDLAAGHELAIGQIRRVADGHG